MCEKVWGVCTISLAALYQPSWNVIFSIQSCAMICYVLMGVIPYKCII